MSLEISLSSISFFLLLYFPHFYLQRITSSNTLSMTIHFHRLFLLQEHDHLQIRLLKSSTVTISLARSVSRTWPKCSENETRRKTRSDIRVGCSRFLPNQKLLPEKFKFTSICETQTSFCLFMVIQNCKKMTNFQCL